MWGLAPSRQRALLFFGHKIRATFPKQTTPCENQRGFLTAVPSSYTARCHPRSVYESKCWPTKPQLLPHLPTLPLTRYPTQTGVPAPLNRVEGSRLPLTYSTAPNSTWAPSKTNHNRTYSALRQRPRVRALWLAGRAASARLLYPAKRSTWVSITKYPKYPSPIKCGWERRATNNTQGLPRVT